MVIDILNSNVKITLERNRFLNKQQGRIFEGHLIIDAEK